MVSENRSVSVSNHYQYISFQNQQDLDPDDLLSSSSQNQIRSEANEYATVEGRRTISFQGLELEPLDFENDNGNQGLVSSSQSQRPIPESSHFPKRIRLRAVESEQEYFLKLINVPVWRKLAISQGVTSALIIILQLILYIITARLNHMIINSIGIGLWAPIIFFLPASLLTWISTRSPNGCSLGTVMGLQITSIFAGLLLTIFGTISLVQHGPRIDWSTGKEVGDAETLGKVICSLIILCASAITLLAFVISLLLCRVACCSKSSGYKLLMFDVEEVK